jgi:protein-tyrosine-phosphatase
MGIRKPGVLFLCVHNAGRSQMAAGFMRQFSDIAVFSGGSEPAGSLNPAAVEAMHEKGIDVSQYVPQRWTMELLESVDVVVTMGCGDECPFIPGKKYIDWPLTDPAGQGLEMVRGVRDEIEQKVKLLAVELLNDQR